MGLTGEFMSTKQQVLALGAIEFVHMDSDAGGAAVDEVNKMKTQEWTFLDKSKWPERGPWDNEPDKAQWTDVATGLPCLAVRAHSHWCGYVGVTEEHPVFGKDYDSLDLSV